jgi:hypothetical protein
MCSFNRRQLVQMHTPQGEISAGQSCALVNAPSPVQMLSLAQPSLASLPFPGLYSQTVVIPSRCARLCVTPNRPLLLAILQD